MDNRLETADFINAMRCRRRCGIYRSVTSRFKSFPRPVYLSDVAAYGSLQGNITLKEGVSVALCVRVLYT